VIACIAIPLWAGPGTLGSLQTSAVIHMGDRKRSRFHFGYSPGVMRFRHFMDRDHQVLAAGRAKQRLAEHFYCFEVSTVVAGILARSRSRAPCPFRGLTERIV
jgi:hypothetical protein